MLVDTQAIAHQCLSCTRNLAMPSFHPALSSTEDRQTKREPTGICLLNPRLKLDLRLRRPPPEMKNWFEFLTLLAQVSFDDSDRPKHLFFYRTDRIKSKTTKLAKIIEVGLSLPCSFENDRNRRASSFVTCIIF